LALITVAAARICVGVAMILVPRRFFKHASGTETLLMRTVGIPGWSRAQQLAAQATAGGHGGTGICVRPNRYALARSLGVPLEPDELALHECDHPLCVKVCAADAPRQHVVAGDQIENMRRMARMRRGGGRSAISSDGLHARRQQSVALRAVLRERGWDRDAVEAALLGDMPTLW
jgi:hypothetical protein